MDHYSLVLLHISCRSGEDDDRYKKLVTHLVAVRSKGEEENLHVTHTHYVIRNRLIMYGTYI
jgi:hypothetical protein